MPQQACTHGGCAVTKISFTWQALVRARDKFTRGTED